MTNVEIATEIINQIPRNARWELGAKGFMAIDNGVVFRTTNLGGVRVEITLNAMDTYDIEAYKVRGLDKIKVTEWFNVYNDQLSTVAFAIAEKYAR